MSSADGDIMVVLVSTARVTELSSSSARTAVSGELGPLVTSVEPASTPLRNRDVRHGRHVDAAVSLEQTLVRRRQEREPVEIVLVVDLDALGQAGRRVARDDQADQHAVHVHLIAVRRGAAAQAAAVREARIDGRVERDDVAGEAVGDRDRPAQVDGVDDVQRGVP